MTFPTTHPALARALAAREYAVPTAVQLAVLDANAAGKDMLVSAQTGSGKTVAFGLAMATTVLGEAERFERAVEPLALIIAPTRELALQVQRELAWLYAETGAQVVTCVGGMDVRAEARQLNFGAHIVVGRFDRHGQSALAHGVHHPWNILQHLVHAQRGYGNVHVS